MVLKEYITGQLYEFERAIYGVVALFENVFKIKNPTRLWRLGNLERTGYLDDQRKIEYAFHGAGCTIEYDNGRTVSFDFNIDNSICYSTFKFMMYLESSKTEEDIGTINQDMVDRIVGILVEEDIVVVIAGCGFRLKDSYFHL